MRPRNYYDWDQLPVMLTVPEAARLLRVSECTVRGMMRARSLAGIKVGKSWRVDRDALRTYMTGGAF